MILKIDNKPTSDLLLWFRLAFDLDFFVVAFIIKSEL